MNYLISETVDLNDSTLSLFTVFKGKLFCIARIVRGKKDICNWQQQKMGLMKHGEHFTCLEYIYLFLSIDSSEELWLEKTLFLFKAA